MAFTTGLLMSKSLAERLFLWAMALLCLVATSHAPAPARVATLGQAELSYSRSTDRYALLPQETVVRSATMPRQPTAPPPGGSGAALLPQDAELRTVRHGAPSAHGLSRSPVATIPDNVRARAPPAA